MKVLVTGGSGFIGKYVVKYLEEAGMEVENWDIANGFDLFFQDKVPDSTDVIIHLAAQLEILNVDPLPELDMNVKGTLHMLELARKGNVKKFIFFSSAAVYGEPHPTVSKESSPLKPFWSYGASKVAAEAYVLQYQRLYGINAVIIRPAIVTGIGEWYGRFVTLSIARMRQKKPILIFGGGTQTRDFVAVEDVALLTLMCVRFTPFPRVIVNAGSEKATSILDMAKMIGDNYPQKFIDPEVGKLGRKPHELHNMCLSMDNCVLYFLWKPHTDMQELIKKEVEWIMGMSDQEFKEWSKVARY